MRMLSLCSGIDGIGLAAKWAGIETVAFCEIEPYPVKVLNKRFPGIPVFDDLRKLNKQMLIDAGVITSDGSRSIDIICAGKRLGENDDRHLWPEVFRIVCELRPPWFFGENVAGHVTLGLDSVLADLDSEGYSARAFLLPAAAVGAPHRRDRVFIVGNTKHHGSHGATLG